MVIPLGQKDKFNATQPKDDLKNFGKYVLKPELAKVLNALFTWASTRDDNRTDIVQALLTGVPGLTQIGNGRRRRTHAEDQPRRRPERRAENRFGVLAGDTQGFPNGRRLGRRRDDIELRVIAGGFLEGQQGPARRRRRPERQAVPGDVPVRGRPDRRVRLGIPKRNEPPHAPIPAARRD